MAHGSGNDDADDGGKDNRPRQEPTRSRSGLRLDGGEKKRGKESYKNST